MKLSLSGAGSRTSASSSLILGLICTSSTVMAASAADLILYNSLSHGEGNLLGRGCTEQFADAEHGAILQGCTDPWMGSGLRFDRPLIKLWEYSHITFLAKAEYSENCMPSFSVTCGWWPRYSGTSVELSGSYIAGGSLVADEWRRVVIPTVDLLSDDVAGLDMYSVNFNQCNPAPKYWITDIRLTDSPPAFGSVSPTDAPTDEPSASPTPYSPTVVWDAYVDDPDGRYVIFTA